jgi:predicted RNA-binding protein with PUA-like domain
MQVWISVGIVKNWETAISENIWGVKETQKNIWEKLQKGDLLLFYATSPISGVIGIAKVENKFKQDKPLWAEEREKNQVIWPYRYDFKVEFVLPRMDWESKKVSTAGVKVNIMAGLSSVKDKETVKLLLQKMDQSWNTELAKLVEEIPTKIIKKEEVNLHDQMKEMLLELGKIEGYIAEKEYIFPDTGERLDVVWRRVAASVPTYVFEVQIGGNLHQALVKLKHAYDLWNSNIFIISEEKDLQKINQLLGGAFHEIRDRVKTLTVEKIKKVHEIQIEDNKLKKEIGFRQVA